MRALVISVCLLLCSTVLMAQAIHSLEGTYKRYLPVEYNKHIKQTLKLNGATAGTYTLDEKGGEVPEFTSGRWKKARVGRDSMEVVILDPENEFECRYYAIEPTGCLTRVYSNGRQEKRRNSFSPVRKPGSWRENAPL